MNNFMSILLILSLINCFSSQAMIRSRYEYDPQYPFYDFLAAEFKSQADIANKSCNCNYSPPPSVIELFPELEELQTNFDQQKNSLLNQEYEELIKTIVEEISRFDSTKVESIETLEPSENLNTEKENVIPEEEFEGSENESSSAPDKRMKKSLSAATSLNTLNNFAESREILKSSSSASLLDAKLLQEIKRKPRKDRPWSQSLSTFAFVESKQILKSPSDGSSSSSSIGAELLRKVTGKAKIKNRPWSESVSTFVNDNHPIILQQMQTKKRKIRQSF